MKTCFEWAQYYFNKGIDIWIPNVAFQWENYQKHEQTLAEIMSYNWKQANAIYGVAGKQGISMLPKFPSA